MSSPFNLQTLGSSFPIALTLLGDVFVVEKILSHRDVPSSRGKIKREYLIRWEGYDPSHDTWEPEKNLSPDLIAGYPISESWVRVFGELYLLFQ